MRFLVLTAGCPPATHSAEYVVRTANKLSTDIVVLHVYEGALLPPDAREAFDSFVEEAVEN